MAVDHYALCPCGSGKKIKFCKCASSIDELEKVMKMVSGSQMVAALDRLNQVLTNHPDAAWALAIKGRLLMSLREHDSLAANSERFIRLQPSNPLALAQRAAAEIFQGEVKAAAVSLLQALAESGRSVDSFLMEISSLLALALARSQNLLSARLYATLPLATTDYEDSKLAQQILGELNRASGVSLLVKNLPSPIPRPDDVSWAERFDEADALLHSNQVLLAESKLEGLDRQFPEQAAIVSGLLTCAVWRADVTVQVRLLKKLSRIELAAGELEDSARLFATASAIKPSDVELSVPLHECVYELENTEEATLSIAANPQWVPLPAESLAQAAEEPDGVPPRAGFQVLDREPLAADAEITSADQVPLVKTVALLFGKQTDRAARLVLLDVNESDREVVEQLVQATLQLSAPAEVKEQSMPLLSLMFPRTFGVNVEELVDQEIVKQLVANNIDHAIGGAKLPLFAGKTLAEAAQDPGTLMFRTAIVRQLEAMAVSLPQFELSLDRLRKLLAIEPLPKLTPQTDEDVEALSLFDLLRVDPSQLDTEGVVYLFQRCSQVNVQDTLKLVANVIVQQDDSAYDSEMVYSAYLALLGNADSLDEALRIVAEAKAWCKSKGMSAGPILLNELQLYLREGDSVGFQKTIETIMTDHSHEPELMAHVQQLLMQLGLLGPDGSPRPAGRPAAAQQSGLWTGDAAQAPPAAQPSASPSQAGGASPAAGKLWLPGMD
ncbi:tetratricopeptide repeat protein [Planctomycetaceae bacterium SH139]